MDFCTNAKITAIQNFGENITNKNIGKADLIQEITYLSKSFVYVKPQNYSK